MSKPVYITWVSPDLARDSIAPAVMARALDYLADEREHVIIVCRRELYDRLMAGQWFMYGAQPVEPTPGYVVSGTFRGRYVIVREGRELTYDFPEAGVRDVWFGADDTVWFRHPDGHDEELHPVAPTP